MSAVDLGRDVSCTDSLRTGRFATRARLVGEAAYRRLTTPRGMLRGGEAEQNYGLDLTELIGSTKTAAEEASLSGRIRSELMKDERIETVEVEVLVTVEGPATIFTITVVAQTSAGPFSLKVLATEVTVELLGITEAVA